MMQDWIIKAELILQKISCERDRAIYIAKLYKEIYHLQNSSLRLVEQTSRTARTIVKSNRII